MQTRRKESRKERCSYRNKRTTALLGDPTLSIFRRLRRDLSTEIGDSKLRGWVASAVSRAIFTIAFASMRPGGSRPGRRGLQGRGGRWHSAVSSERRVHNTDGPMISEILHGTKRGGDVRVFTCICICTYIHAHMHIAVCRLYHPGVVTLYRRDIEPRRSSSPQIPEYLKEDGPTYRARDPIPQKYLRGRSRCNWCRLKS